MNKEDKKIWLELYSVASELEKLEPWNYLWDSDILTFVSKEQKDIFYFSVMGKATGYKSIAIYQGSQIHSIYELGNNKYPKYALGNYQNCLTCNFLSEEETMSSNIKLIKDLGFQFTDSWISFECFEKGYAPGAISINQAKVLIDVLKNFYEMFLDIKNDKVQIDFDNEETLSRHYDLEQEKYVNEVKPLMLPKKQYLDVNLDEKLLEDVKKAPLKNVEIEYDYLNYLPLGIEGFQENGRLYYPRFLIMAEATSGFIIGQKISNKNDYASESDYIKECLENLANFIIEQGKPKAIYVRDNDAMYYLRELSQAAHIKVIISPRLKVIDEATEYMCDSIGFLD